MRQSIYAKHEDQLNGEIEKASLPETFASSQHWLALLHIGPASDQRASNFQQRYHNSFPVSAYYAALEVSEYSLPGNGVDGGSQARSTCPSQREKVNEQIRCSQAVPHHGTVHLHDALVLCTPSLCLTGAGVFRMNMNEKLTWTFAAVAAASGGAVLLTDRIEAAADAQTKRILACVLIFW